MQVLLYLASPAFLSPLKAYPGKFRRNRKSSPLANLEMLTHPLEEKLHNSTMDVLLIDQQNNEFVLLLATGEFFRKIAACQCYTDLYTLSLRVKQVVK